MSLFIIYTLKFVPPLSSLADPIRWRSLVTSYVPHSSALNFSFWNPNVKGHQATGNGNYQLIINE